ncbi:NAD(P)H-binding protein [Martelella radicis]|uniref:Nucleoside-diphosphate-sugar epimerase n=1 Tax=Martelella radicis TaxID=1397476 RepID=A0A7W6PB27_9HYPH|nr:NAD(P)H-binding protein [Martelella radicis]MBB4123460.1 nucleoside-diphosphate-sugar epimerase [Martelella radicis]
MTETNSPNALVTRPLALILGASGGVGGAVAAALHRRGYRIRAMNRNHEKQTRKFPAYEWVAGDAMKLEDVMAAAEGATLIFHGVNPPGYRNWQKLVLPMLDNTITAAKANRARILFPGTVYNFGPDALPGPTEDSPQNATTRKGRIRIEVEARLREAAWNGTQVILVRAGDFFGGSSGANSWFGQMVKPGKPLRSVTRLSAPGTGHQWAYLPDLGETFAALDARARELPAYANFHFEGYWDEDGTGMIEAIRRAANNPDLPARPFPWFLVPLLAPFMPLMREVLEIRYLWRTPMHMKNDRLVKVLGHEPRTPLDEAVRRALGDLGAMTPEEDGARQPSAA